jgi:hypothetical protein
MLAMLMLLADDDDTFSIFIACLFLLIIVASGAYAVIWLRKRFWGSEDDEVPFVGFTLGDLRSLHKSGRISAEEFEKAKEKIVAAAKRAAERDVKSANPKVRNQPPGGQ